MRAAGPWLAAGLLAWAGPARAVLYYVNDGFTNGDVYCGAIGITTNDGLTTNTPKLTIANLLATYTLAAGDTVYIDTGLYSNSAFSVTTSGIGTNRITFQGSTNMAAGGSVLRNTIGTVISLSGASNVTFANLTLWGGAVGVYSLNNSNTCRFYRVVFRDMSTYGLQIGNSGQASSHDAQVENCIFANNASAHVWVYDAVSRTQIRNCSFWGGDAIYYRSGGIYLTNNIIRVSGSAKYAYSFNLPSSSDYNIYLLTNAAWIYSGYPRLEDYQAGTTNDLHSTHADPAFADPANYDFHVQSAVGRWTTNGWTTDSATAPGIDFGLPASAYANEPEPNGSRINCGAYGNTPEASLSNTNPWLRCITFNRRALVTGTQTLYWIAANFAATGTVAVQYSADGGGAWSNLAIGVRATNQAWVWNTALSASSVRGMWKVVSESNTNIYDTSDFITLKNTPVAVYVNDPDTNGDIYCTAPGSDANTGATPGDPVYSIQKVIDSYTLGAGDTVYIDTGWYTNSVSLQGEAFGSAGNPLVFQGSTNYAGATNGAAGGPTIIQRAGVYVVSLSRTPPFNAYIRLADLTIKGGTIGLYLQGHNYCEFYRLIVRDNSSYGMGMGGGGQAASDNCRIDNCIFANNSSYAVFNYTSAGTVINNATIYSQWGVSLTVAGGTGYISNSVFRVSGSTYYAYGTLPTRADYNTFVTTNGAGIMSGYMTLTAFQAAYTNHDQHSQQDNPLFADPANNDFHERSADGRWTTNGWVADAVSSPVIDAAEPAAIYTNEPAPNGGRRNAGAYGNTAEAAKSTTNPSLHVLTFNTGGILRGTGTVYWTAQNFGAGATARIQYSADGGETWTNVVTDLPATNQAYVWVTAPFTSSLRGRWRIVSTDDPNVNSTNGTYFTLKNQNLAAYVNDAYTNGDVYCTAVGSDTNTGVAPDVPRLTLQSLQNDYSFSGGDTIYMDTGLYTNAVVFDGYDIGSSGNPLVIQGSANYAAGVATMISNSSGTRVSFSFAPYIRLADLTLWGGSYGVYSINNSHYCQFYRVIFRNMATCGLQMGGSGQTASSYPSLENCIFFNNGSQQVSLWDAVSQTQIRNCTFWGSNAVSYRSGGISLTNNVICVSGSGNYAYSFNLPTTSDYNIFYLINSARMSGGIITLATFTNANPTLERHSRQTDPLFADPFNYDFHERSAMARWTTNGWVTDTVYSPAIDAGDPQSSYALEVKPNGRRANCGAYGNTPEAGQSRYKGTVLVVR